MAVIGFSNVYAYDFEIDGLRYTLHTSGDNVILVGTTQSSGNLIIPNKVNYRNRSFIVSSVGKGAFKGCQFSKVYIPGSVRYIGEEAFCNAGISALELSEGIVMIGVKAFEHTNITSLTIPDSVSMIGDFAFRGCEKIKSLYLGRGLEKIDIGAFAGCENIDTVVCYSDVPPEMDCFERGNLGMIPEPVFTNSVYQFAILKVPAISIGKYRKSLIWKNFKTIEPVSDEPLTQFEQLSVEWDMLDNENEAIKIRPNWNRFSTQAERLSMPYYIFPNDRFKLFSIVQEENEEFYAFSFSEVTNKKGKTRLKYESSCNPFGQGIILKYRKDGTFMLGGKIKLPSELDYEDFFTSPLNLVSGPNIFEGCTSSGKTFSIQIYKEISPEGIRFKGKWEADVKVLYMDSNGVEHRIIVALLR